MADPVRGKVHGQENGHEQRQVYALLVGVDTYPEPVPPLQGCANDVNAMLETLRGRVGTDSLHELVLTNEEATRAAVTAGLQDHLTRAGPDDVALFYFSGHGSQQAAPEGLWLDEPDLRNETLVCFDSRMPDVYDLADKEVAALLGGVAGTGCHLLAVLDCCHSGGGTRDVTERVRLAPEDPRLRPGESVLPAAVSAAAHLASGPTRSLPPAPARWTPAVGGHVLLAACRSSERAKEVVVRGTHRGALSSALESALREHDGAPTYRQLLRIVTAGVLRRTDDQHPQVETFDAVELDRPFLGGAIASGPRQLTLSQLPDGWSIDSGAVHGVPDPVGDDTTELAVYPLQGETTGDPLTTATVTKVLPDRSIVELASPLDPAFVYRAVIMSIPLRPLAIGVIGGDDDKASLRAAAEAADATLVTLVDDPAHADLVVQARDEGFAITRPGVQRPLVPVVGGIQREARTVAALEHVARWIRLSGLRNPATRLPDDAIAVAVTTEGGGVADDGSVTISYAGDRAPQFTLNFTNESDHPLWAAVLDLTETYGIFTDAFPSGSVALGPGEATSVTLAGQVSDELWQAGTLTVTDHLKVVTSTLEFDPRSLEQAELDVTSAPPTAAPRVTRSDSTPRSTLDRLLTAVTTRRASPVVAKAAVADWRTDDLYVVTTRPRPT